MKNKEVLHRVREKRNILNKYLGKKGRLAGSDTSCGCLLKHIIEGKIKGTRRRGRGCKRLLDDLKKTIRYWILKGEALDRTVWGTHFGRSNGPVLRQCVMIRVARTNSYTSVSVCVT